MRKILRETIREIKDHGGTDVEVSHGGRHTKVSFTAGGVRRELLIHSGNKVLSRFERGRRSNLRRLGL